MNFSFLSFVYNLKLSRFLVFFVSGRVGFSVLFPYHFFVLCPVNFCWFKVLEKEDENCIPEHLTLEIFFHFYCCRDL